jgi:hypothetical protein
MKIPLSPPFPKGDIYTPLLKRGVKGDFIINVFDNRKAFSYNFQQAT